MSFLASELIGRVSVMGARQAMSDLEGVGRASDSAGHRMDSALKFGAIAAVAAGAAVIGLGVASAKMAGDFQAGLTTLVTGAGEARSAIGAVGQGILKISVDTATSTNTLIKSMFQIESAGYRGAAGLQVLKIAAEGARVGNSDLTKTTDVLLTTMHNYHLSAGQTAGVMNSLVVTMQNGRMVMDDLNAALVKVLPTASALKIPLQDVQGALDSMSASGDKGAAAGTHLAMMFKMLSQPVGSAKKEMAAMGIDSIKLAETMRTSLPDAFKMIQDAVSQHFTPGSVEYNRAIASILGGSKSGVAGLEILSGGMKLLQSNTDAAAKALSNGGSSVQGWTDVQKDFNFQLDKAGAMLHVLAIQVGTNLMPIFTDLLNKAIIPLVNQFSDWLNNGGGLKDVQTVFTSLGSFLQDVIIPGFEALLNNAIVPLAEEVGNFYQSMQNLFQAFQQGQAYANVIAIALGTIGTAIAAIKLEEFLAGLYNAFDEMSAGAGIIATVANNALPELGQALGWIKGQAVASSIAVEGIGAASVEAEGVVVASSAAMTLALGAATLGISLLVGAVIAGIVASTVRGQTAMTDSTKKAYDSLGQTSDDMKAKQQADAAEVVTSWKTTAGEATSRWQGAGKNIAQAAGDAKAAWILAQQQIRDEATKAAATVDAAWVQASQDMDLAALYAAAGLTGPEAQRLLNGPGSTFVNSQGQTVSNSTPGGNSRAAGGMITEPVIGIGLRTGERWSFGESGPEMVVPFGGRTSPTNPQAQSSGASNQTINLQIDGRTFARLILPHIVGNIRTATGVRV